MKNRFTALTRGPQRLVLLVLVMALLGVFTIYAQQEGNRNVVFVFDASGSMNAAMEGTTRLAIAKEAMTNLTGQMEAVTLASLWVYGHRLPQSDPAASCMDIEQIITLDALDRQQFADAVANLNAIGYTPISTTLEMAAASLPPGEINSIILISDGEETCAGNPCAVAQALHAANVDLVVNTIGFAADAATRQQLQCIAEVTGGLYLDAPGADELNAALLEITTPPGSIRIVDPAGNVLPDIGFRVTQAESGAPIGTYAGSASLPAGVYSVRVQVDPVIEQPVTLEPDAVVDIVVTPIAIGTVTLVDTEGNPVTDVSLSIIDPTSGERLGTRNGSINVPPGDYTAEVRALIPFEQAVTVVNGEITEIVVDTSAGTLITVDENGEAVDGITLVITQAETGQQLFANSNGIWKVPPGTYNIEIRTQLSSTLQVTVGNEETVEIPVDTRTGTITSVDQNGNPVSGVTFIITHTESGEELFANSDGVWDVPPGTYAIEVRTQLPFTTQVTVGAGETVEIAVDLENGAIQSVDQDGNPIDGVTFVITHVESGEELFANNRGTWEVPPGTYDIEVRTQIRETVQVVVAPGQTVAVEVDTRTGTIISVDADGNPIDGVTFVITHIASGERLFGNNRGSWDVPPGDYSIEVRTDERYTIEVTVGAGETVPVTVNE
jgi:hypothetical protein